MTGINERVHQLIGNADVVLPSADGQDAESSMAHSLLAIAIMLEDAVVRERTHDALIAENDRLDEAFGDLGGKLRLLAEDLPQPLAIRLGTILREAGL